MTIGKTQSAKVAYLPSTIESLEKRAEHLEEQAARVEAAAIRLLGSEPTSDEEKIDKECPASYMGQLNGIVGRLGHITNRLDNANSRLEEAL